MLSDLQDAMLINRCTTSAPLVVLVCRWIFRYGCIDAFRRLLLNILLADLGQAHTSLYYRTPNSLFGKFTCGLGFVRFGLDNVLCGMLAELDSISADAFRFGRNSPHSR